MKKSYPIKYKMRSITWRGFRITIWNNHVYGFRYEYTIEPLGMTSKRLTIHRGKMIPIIYDPTSMPNIQATILYAKIAIDELRTPLRNKQQRI